MESDALGSGAGVPSAGAETPVDARETQTPIPEAAELSRQREATSKLSIRGNGFTFDRDVPETVALQIMKLVITGVAETDSGAGDAPRGERKGGRQQSLAEFFREVGPKKMREKLVTIAAYLHDIAGRDSFTPDELKAQFRGVKETAPANIHRDIGDTVGEAWFAEEPDQQGVYYITQSGLDAVEAKFSTDGGRRASRGRRKPRKSPKSGVTEAPSNGE